MTAPAFNAAFRPLAKAAWMAQCALTGRDPADSFAYDIWYREQLLICISARSTKGLPPARQQLVIDHFRALADAAAPPVVGWTPAQNTAFLALAQKAWNTLAPDRPGPFAPWLAAFRARHCIGPGTRADHRDSFDRVMAALAIIARDEYWIDRAARAPETRMRWQIEQFLADLDYLAKTTHTWAYVRAIWRQADMLPEDISDAPAQLLWKVLQMLDTHIRRLCRDYALSPSDLPSRLHPPAVPIPIREANTHLHVGHSLDHCPPLAIPSSIPF